MRGKLYLPRTIKLTCGKCEGRFSVGLRSIDGKSEIVCPFCSMSISVYRSLEPEVRILLYRTAREKVEERVIGTLESDGEVKGF